MLKFFRKIRQNLLIEGKTSKYFKYAIGEIVLVVIGILIALQINNWNEDRKLQEEEKVLLQNLYRDFKDNKQEIEGDINGKIKLLNSINLLYATIAGERQFSGKQIDSLLNTMLTVINFTENSSTISAISTNGKIDIIQNDSLKNLFSKWLFSVNKNELYTQYIYDQFSNGLNPVLKKTVSYQSIYKHRPRSINPHIPDSVYQMVSKAASPFKSNHGLLFNDPVFENTLRTVERGQLSSLNANYTMLTITNQILSALTTELNQ